MTMNINDKYFPHRKQWKISINCNMVDFDINDFKRDNIHDLEKSIDKMTTVMRRHTREDYVKLYTDKIEADTIKLNEMIKKTDEREREIWMTKYKGVKKYTATVREGDNFIMNVKFGMVFWKQSMLGTDRHQFKRLDNINQDYLTKEDIAAMNKMIADGLRLKDIFCSEILFTPQWFVKNILL